ncbi:hypothetical protein [Streptomyces sp. MJM8645]|uniref:hypothetical protein n=1 Tax=Streptomyces sp. MJM8645 TaxID=1120523 RepID=UPI0007AFC7D9|nr:hypothetical protein [Streptomyces sp. MJM8645]
MTATPNQMAAALAAAPDQAFADMLIDFVTHPQANQLATVFRSPEVVKRVARTTERLLANHHVVQADGESRNAYTKRVRQLRTALEQEQQLAQVIAAGDAARAAGRIDRGRNPAQRARRRLADMFPAEYTRLRHEEEEEVARLRRATKNARRARTGSRP